MDDRIYHREVGIYTTVSSTCGCLLLILEVVVALALLIGPWPRGNCLHRYLRVLTTMYDSTRQYFPHRRRPTVASLLPLPSTAWSLRRSARSLTHSIHPLIQHTSFAPSIPPSDDLDTPQYLRLRSHRYARFYPGQHPPREQDVIYVSKSRLPSRQGICASLRSSVLRRKVASQVKLHLD